MVEGDAEKKLVISDLLRKLVEQMRNKKKIWEVRRKPLRKEWMEPKRKYLDRWSKSVIKIEILENKTNYS